MRGRELHDVHMFNLSRTDTIEHAIQTLQREGLVPTDRPIFSAAPEEQAQLPLLFAPAVENFPHVP